MGHRCGICFGEFATIDIGLDICFHTFCDGLYFDDFLIEISITDMQNIFESLGYKVKISTLDSTSKDPANLIQKHHFKISWPTS